MLYTKEIAVYSDIHETTYGHGASKRQSSLNFKNRASYT
jgi:hypothetical protein